MVWIPVALSRDVPPGATRAVILDGQELVIWRAESGKAHVWEDRCPHRGMRLSLGFLRGDTLNCLYHGWQYGETASCRRIPAHPDLVVPATIRANPCHSLEAGGMVWIGSPEVPAPVLRDGLPVATLAMDAGIEVVCELLGARQRTGIQLLDAELGGEPIQLGWHRPGPGRILLHVTHSGSSDVVACLAALREVRDFAEARQAA